MKPAKEAKAKFETYLVTAEAKIKNSLIKFRVVLTQLIFFFNIFSSLLPHLSQIIQRSNILLKMNDLLGSLSFMKKSPFSESIHKINFFCY